MRKIKISEVKRIREELELQQVIIIGIAQDGTEHVATHGKSPGDAKMATEAAGEVKRILLKWPKEFCDVKPLERICENCEFWERGHIDHSMRIPEHWPGKCCLAPEKVARFEKDIACGQFSPKY
jgi:hypothetical protein